MLGCRYEVLVDGSIALGTTVTIGASDVMHPFRGFVDAVELGELLFGGFVVGEIFAFHHSLSFTV
jgi:hypothetical protein